jgi:hypothetical protein
MYNINSIQSELQKQSLQEFSSQLELLRRYVLTPGEPGQFNWVHGAINKRVMTLECALAQQPENTAIRTMLHDYRQIENQAWSVATQPPYTKPEKVLQVRSKRKAAIWTIIRKVAFISIYYIGVSCCV